MNNFEYSVQIQKADTLKTLSQKREYMDDMYKRLHVLNSSDNVGTQEYINTYKCFTRGFYLDHGSKGLPLFMVDTEYNETRKLMLKLVKDTSYQPAADAFEFKDGMSIRNLSYEDVRDITQMVGSNVPHFKFNLSYRNANRYSYLTYDPLTGNDDFDSSITKIMQCEDIKRSLPTKDNTVINGVLDELYTKNTETGKVTTDSVAKLQEIVDNLQYVVTEMAGKVPKGQ